MKITKEQFMIYDAYRRLKRLNEVEKYLPKEVIKEIRKQFWSLVHKYKAV